MLTEKQIRDNIKSLEESYDMLNKLPLDMIDLSSIIALSTMNGELIAYRDVLAGRD